MNLLRIEMRTAAALESLVFQSPTWSNACARSIEVHAPQWLSFFTLLLLASEPIFIDGIQLYSLLRLRNAVNFFL